jgi:hypothetical protein
LHRVIPDIGDLSIPIEEALKKHFFPALAGKVDISEVSRELFALPVKFAGIAIPNNPITSAETIYKDSTLVCSHLIRALRGQGDPYGRHPSLQRTKGKSTNPLSKKYRENGTFLKKNEPSQEEKKEEHG